MLETPDRESERGGRSMKIVVLGASGFVGSHVADALTEAGHRVTLFDLNPSPWKKDNQRMVLGDVQDSRAVDQVIRGQEIVFNFAGFSDIEEAQRHPLETIRANVLGNGIVLEACRKRGVRRYLFASTIYVYSDVPSFYRASKQACEAYIDVYQRLHGVNSTVLRFGSLYGPRAKDNNGIRTFLRNAVEKGRIVYWGTGEEVREYVHIKDAARSCVDALKPAYANTCLLLTGAQSMRVRDLLTMIREMMRGKTKIVYRPHSRPDLSSLHYTITPYAFVPKEARKILRAEYFDMGQGILSVLEDLQAEKDARKK